MMTAKHALAGALIGLPWCAGATGEDAFDCWGLVQFWHRELYGIDMGAIAVAVGEDSPAQVLAIRAAVHAGGWVQASEPQDGDVVLMRNAVTRGRHIGVLLHANNALGLLHCEGSIEDPTPGVIWEPLVDVQRRYQGLELWRRA